jgi:exodeoxyribonuclease VII large subunit
MNITPQPTGEIYSVSALNREVRALLENNFATIWVEGEISNFAAPHSGHWYFSIKDANAQVRAAMFRPNNRLLGFTPKDGMHVLAKARISLYEGRGDYQLIVEFLEDAGKGKLQKAFEALKKRLTEAGLFDATHKKPLPSLPQCIGVITSPTGAAIRDILNVLRRRFPAIPVIIYPTLVQGDSAAPAIVQMIQTANTRNECDLLILARGGGSLEDLWPFNEETVAYAVYNSQIPIITGVGHEVDFTIVDFVADLRAPTPSAAAELVTPAADELIASLKQRQHHLARLMSQQLNYRLQQVEWMFKHLQQQHPKQRLIERTQQLDLLTMELVRQQTQIMNNYQFKLQQLQAKLAQVNPLHSIREFKHQLSRNLQSLYYPLSHSLHKNQKSLGQLSVKLDALSPLATLKRGYAIVTRKKEQHILRKSKEVNIGDSIEIQLDEGKLSCTVEDLV